jgi:hypothetical protein
MPTEAVNFPKRKPKRFGALLIKLEEARPFEKMPAYRSPAH